MIHTIIKKDHPQSNPHALCDLFSPSVNALQSGREEKQPQRGGEHKKPELEEETTGPQMGETPRTGTPAEAGPTEAELRARQELAGQYQGPEWEAIGYYPFDS